MALPPLLWLRMMMHIFPTSTPACSVATLRFPMEHQDRSFAVVDLGVQKVLKPYPRLHGRDFPSSKRQYEEQ